MNHTPTAPPRTPAELATSPHDLLPLCDAAAEETRQMRARIEELEAENAGLRREVYEWYLAGVQRELEVEEREREVERLREELARAGEGRREE